MGQSSLAARDLTLPPATKPEKKCNTVDSDIFMATVKARGGTWRILHSAQRFVPGIYEVNLRFFTILYSEPAGFKVCRK
ncbi:hypothetical protein D3C77_674550 [compost metagenome]